MGEIIQFPTPTNKRGPWWTVEESEPITYITCECDNQAFRLQSDGHLECLNCSGVYHPDTIWSRDKDGWVIQDDE